MMRWRDHTKATISSTFSVVSMIVSIAILGFAVMSGTSDAFASSSINNSVSKSPWNSKLQSSASSSSTETATAVNGETGDNNVKTSEVLSLDSIRASLIRQEETIIFAVIERAQFRQNKVVYERGAIGLDSIGSNKDECFLEYMLTETEKLDSGLRRYIRVQKNTPFKTLLNVC